MAGQGLVLYRDKRRAPWALHVLYGFAALMVIGPAMATGSLFGLAVGLPLLVFTWLLLAVLRVTVSAGSINVQYGLFGPEIPISAVESVEAARYDWRKFGGWGIRRGPGGAWIYSMPGDGGNAVKIVWRDRKRRRRTTLIGSWRADELARQVEVARAALPGGPQFRALEPGDGDPSQ